MNTVSSLVVFIAKEKAPYFGAYTMFPIALRIFREGLLYKVRESNVMLLFFIVFILFIFTSLALASKEMFCQSLCSNLKYRASSE